MKKILVLYLISFFLLFVSWSPSVRAEDKDDSALKEKASAIDKKANEPEGKKHVVEKLENQYHVSDERINKLREQKLGYGEIGIVFSMAEKMPGGINDDNIKKIMELRQGGTHKEGWGKIANELNLKPGDIRERVNKVNSDIEEEHSHAIKTQQKNEGQKENFEKTKNPTRSSDHPKFDKSERMQPPGKSGKK